MWRSNSSGYCRILSCCMVHDREGSIICAIYAQVVERPNTRKVTSRDRSPVFGTLHLVDGRWMRRRALTSRTWACSGDTILNWLDLPLLDLAPPWAELLTGGLQQTNGYATCSVIKYSG